MRQVLGSPAAGAAMATRMRAVLGPDRAARMERWMGRRFGGCPVAGRLPAGGAPFARMALGGGTMMRGVTTPPGPRHVAMHDADGTGIAVAVAITLAAVAAVAAIVLLADRLRRRPGGPGEHGAG